MDLVEAAGRLGEEHPEIVELDLNPVVCTPSAPVCVDVKVRAPHARDRAENRTSFGPGPGTGVSGTAEA